MTEKHDLEENTRTAAITGIQNTRKASTLYGFQKILAIAIPVSNTTENEHSPFVAGVRAAFGGTFPSPPASKGVFVDLGFSLVVRFTAENIDMGANETKRRCQLR